MLEALAHVRARRARANSAVLTWLCGPRGCGKTHLLQAMCAAASERMRAGYVPLGMWPPSESGVLEGLPQLDCLCLDDIDAVAGQEQWERGIFALLHELEDAGGG